ncbi:TonB-dependent receptor, partial [Alistipes onderdonkii]|nr:TonB-dependent receptor [Alistipes onderdonkii]
HTGRLDLYASAWADLGKHTAVSDEHTDYTTGDTNLTSQSEITERDRNFGGSIGSVFEISPKHSIGAEFEYWRNTETGPNDSYTDFTDAGAVTRSESRYGI